MKLVVIDYESGNLRSVSRALESQGVTPLVIGDASEFGDADAMVLPGVGSGPSAMDALNQRNLVDPIRDYISSGRPFLGVVLACNYCWTGPRKGTRRALVSCRVIPSYSQPD